MELRRIDTVLLPAFRPYLLPEAIRAIEEGWEEVVAVGAVTEDFRTCGAAACIADGDDLVLFSLYVDPQLRRQGVASLLLDGLERAAGRLTAAEWVLPREDVPPLDAFLQKRGFGPAEVEEGGVMRLDAAAMRSLPVVRRAFMPGYRPDGNILPLSDITREERTELLADESIDPRLRLDNFTEEQLNSPMSLGYRYGGRIAAYFLAEPAADGAAVLAAVSREGAHGGAFFQLAAAAIHASLPYLPPDGGAYWVEAINDAAETLARYLCGDTFRLWHAGSARREV